MTDTERLDWLSREDMFEDRSENGAWLMNVFVQNEETLREAIDEAMRAEYLTKPECGVVT